MSEIDLDFEDDSLGETLDVGSEIVDPIVEPVEPEVVKPKPGRPKKNEEKKEKQVNNHMVNHMENENEDDNVDINKVPSFEIFLEYALLHKPLIDEFHLKAKYDSWIGNGWKDGFDTKIKNWKLKLRSTLSFIKEKSKENKHEQLSNITTAIRASNPKA